MKRGGGNQRARWRNNVAVAVLGLVLWTGIAETFVAVSKVPSRSQVALGNAELRSPGRRTSSLATKRETPEAPKDWLSLLGLALVGAFLGPFVDAIHNQALLSYDVLPASFNLLLGFAKTSWLVPPLLAMAYTLLGRVLPGLVEAFLGSNAAAVGSLPLLKPPPVVRALLAVLSTCFIIKCSELLLLATSGSVALLLLSLLALLQWAALDGRASSLALALLAGFLGPVAELPLIYLGAWHYITPDYWPLAFLGLGPGSWAGLSMVTGPCYFAVTTDAIALGRLFAGK